MANVLAVCEQQGGAFRKVSREAVAAARLIADALGGSVDAMVLGAPGIDLAPANLGDAGADRILVAADDSLGHYSPEGYADAIAKQAKSGSYAAVIFGATATGRDLAPRVAVRLDVPVAVDAVTVGVDGGKVACVRPVFAGKAFQNVVLEASPALVTIRPNTFTPASSGKAGAIEHVAVTPGATRVKVRELKAAAAGVLDVGEASIVVSGGRGLKGPENFHLVEDLAKAFGQAAVGASRAVVDAGWRPHHEQVGQTGKTVSPQLYVAVGISGAIQHLAGMRTAKVIVAINKDKDAPIFKVADYGIIGDAFEIVPALAAQIRKVRG